MTINELIKKYEDKAKQYDKDDEIEPMDLYLGFIQDLKELQPTTIMGHTIEEVITILSALDLERILDIKMTMDNLKIIADKMEEDFKKTLSKLMKKMIKNHLGTNNE